MLTLPLKQASIWFNSQLLSESAYLIPLRIFIGIGWVRAALEKFTDPEWAKGTALTQFLNDHVSSGMVEFPYYQNLVQDVFTPNVLPLSWLIMLGQILTGVAIMTGTFTNIALVCGLFMNLNFILIGEVNPSAFYVVIQIALLVTNVGYSLGVDALLARKIPIGWIIAQPYSARKYWRLERGSYLGVTTAMALLALSHFQYIESFTPDSVEDPAMIILVLSVIIGLSALITAYKFPQNKNAI
jgi:uncharacterized membrane protein YphA (DoxX/SURF4 family)